jgi:hypothetical protein
MSVDAMSALLRRVRSEYAEMPGLSLTKAQMQRLFALEEPVCDAVLEALIQLHLLRETRCGTYVLTEH